MSHDRYRRPSSSNHDAGVVYAPRRGGRPGGARRSDRIYGGVRPSTIQRKADPAATERLQLGASIAHAARAAATRQELGMPHPYELLDAGSAYDERPAMPAANATAVQRKAVVDAMDAPNADSIREDRATIEPEKEANLSPRKLARAQRRNPVHAQRLGFAAADFGSGAAVGSAAFAGDVARYQAAHDLTVDGIAGPRTSAVAGVGPGQRGTRRGAASGPAPRGRSDELEPGVLGPQDELEPGVLGPQDELEPGVLGAEHDQLEDGLLGMDDPLFTGAAPQTGGGDTLESGLIDEAVQGYAMTAADDPAAVHAAAAHGLGGAATDLPYRTTIEAATGADLSGVKAHIGGPAAEGAAAIGAQAYASGDHVAFATTPDLHTAAHEASHVLQQRGGVQLKGGVGQAGDSYEQHADAVADKVVRGESAQALLGEHSAARVPGGDGRVQKQAHQQADSRNDRATTGLAARGGSADTPLSIQPDVIDCGREYAGSGSARRTLFRVRAPLDAELQAYVEPIEGLPRSDAAMFQVAPDAFQDSERAPRGLGQNHSGTVVFSPTKPGAFKAALRVESPDGSRASALLEGVADPTDANACGEDGPFLVTGHEAAMTPDAPMSKLSVRNTCGGPLSLSGVIPISGDASEFKLHPPGLPIELEPGQQAEISAEFVPTAAQPDSELTLLLTTNLPGVSAEVTIAAHRDNFLGKDGKQRSELVREVGQLIQSANTSFADACNAKITALSAEADDHGFLGMVVDVALGFLIPGLGEALLGEAIVLTLSELPNTNVANRIGSVLIDYQEKVIGAIVEPLGKKVKSIVTSGGLTSSSGLQDTNSDGPSKGNSRNSPEAAVIKRLIDQMHIEMTELAVSAGSLTDSELLGLASLYDPRMTTQSTYEAQLDSFIDQYRAEVKPIGKASGPTTRFGGEHTKHLAWIRDEEGGKHLAICWMAAGPMGIPMGGGGWTFSHWVSPRMMPLALEKDPRPPTLSRRQVNIEDSDWLLNFEAARN